MSDDVERLTRTAVLLLSKWTVEEIAKRDGSTVEEVESDAAALADRWHARLTSDRTTQIAEELAKCDWLERTFLPSALQGDKDAADRIIKIMDRRYRLLGLEWDGVIPEGSALDDLAARRARRLAALSDSASEDGDVVGRGSS